MVRVKIAKNHCTGKHGEFSMPMYYGHGIDDVRCTVEWLVAEKWWSLKDGTLITRGEVQGKEVWKLNQFLQAVTDDQLQEIAQTAWDTIDAGLRRRGRWAVNPEETEEPAEEPEMFEE
jgi:hypothetical protein